MEGVLRTQQEEEDENDDEEQEQEEVAAVVVKEEGPFVAVYAMGFFQNKVTAAEVRAAVAQKAASGAAKMAVVIDNAEHTVEVLLLLPQTEEAEAEAEDARLEACVSQTGLMSVQAVEVIRNDADQGAACVERLLLRTEPNEQQEEERALFFDLYRATSGGRMHHADTRRWQMSPAALHRLWLEEQRLGGSLVQLAAERQQVSSMVIYVRMVVDAMRLWVATTRTLLVPTGGAEAADADEAFLCLLREAEEEDEEEGSMRYHNRLVLDHNQLELQRLEDHEIELIQEMERVRERMDQARRVLWRQDEIAQTQQQRKRRRTRWASGGSAAPGAAAAAAANKRRRTLPAA